jgi:hypothetical protein
MIGATTHQILVLTLLGTLFIWIVIFAFLALRPKSMHQTRQPLVYSDTRPHISESQARLHRTAPQPIVQIERAQM